VSVGTKVVVTTAVEVTIAVAVETDVVGCTEMKAEQNGVALKRCKTSTMTLTALQACPESGCTGTASTDAARAKRWKEWNNFMISGRT
jgi:hypothetical protein